MKKYILSSVFVFMFVLGGVFINPGQASANKVKTNHPCPKPNSGTTLGGVTYDCVGGLTQMDMRSSGDIKDTTINISLTGVKLGTDAYIVSSEGHYIKAKITKDNQIIPFSASSNAQDIDVLFTSVRDNKPAVKTIKVSAEPVISAERALANNNEVSTGLENALSKLNDIQAKQDKAGLLSKISGQNVKKADFEALKKQILKLVGLIQETKKQDCIKRLKAAGQSQDAIDQWCGNIID